MQLDVGEDRGDDLPAEARRDRLDETSGGAVLVATALDVGEHVLMGFVIVDQPVVRLMFALVE